jgi:hypothetical protein
VEDLMNVVGYREEDVSSRIPGGWLSLGESWKEEWLFWVYKMVPLTVASLLLLSCET